MEQTPWSFVFDDMISPLDRLLLTLEVRLEAFALLDVRQNYRLTFDALDSVIIHYVLSGHGWLDTPGRAPTRCDAGTLVILPAGFAQSLRVSEEPTHEVKAIERCGMVRDGMIRFDATGGEGPPDLQLLCGSMMPTANGSYGLFDGLKGALVENFEDLPVVDQAFNMLRAEVANPGIGARALAGSLMKFCLVLLIRRHLTRLAHQSPLLGALGDERLTRAVSAVLDAPAQPHTVASLAQVAGMSRSAFSDAFTGAFDASPMQFVAKARLHHAAELLRSADLPIKLVAASIGFASRSHFTRAFRRAYGCDPRTFRKHGGASVDAPHLLRGRRADFALAPEADEGRE